MMFSKLKTQQTGVGNLKVGPARAALRFIPSNRKPDDQQKTFSMSLQILRVVLKYPHECLS
jgi:hypothetical protein